MADLPKDKSYKDLQVEIERLQKALDAESTARTSAELAALSAAGTPIAGGGDEQPTGKTVEIEVCLDPWRVGTKEKPVEHKFKTVKVPTFFYRIDLPVGAGTHLTTNGLAMYHGETYELTPEQLADTKSRVARCWDHEKSIHGDNENAYRRHAPGWNQLGI